MDEYGVNPLHQAALAASADPNVKDDDGGTPLHWAAQEGHARAAALLE